MATTDLRHRYPQYAGYSVSTRKGSPVGARSFEGLAEIWKGNERVATLNLGTVTASTMVKKWVKPVLAWLADNSTD